MPLLFWSFYEPGLQHPAWHLITPWPLTGIGVFEAKVGIA